jgi:hypothetical protein
MKKFCVVFCLVVWLVQLGITISWVINSTPVNTFLYLLAVLVCILHYVGELIKEY